MHKSVDKYMKTLFDNICICQKKIVYVLADENMIISIG